MKKVEITREKLYDLYIISNLSSREIGEIYNVSRSAIDKWLKKFNIPIKSPEQIKDSAIRIKKEKGSIFNVDLDKETLYDLYIVKNYSKSKIADKYGITYSAVHTLIKKYNLIKSYEMAKNAKINYIIEKYGVDNVSKNDCVKNKIVQTCLKNNGVPYGSQSEKAKEKIRECAIVQRQEHYDDFTSEILSNKKSLEKFLKDNVGMTVNAMVATLKCTNTTLFKKIREYGLEDVVKSFISRPEKEISDFLDSLNVKYERHNRQIISPQELDFYCPDYNISIEFNGIYWHSKNHLDMDGRDGKNYHFNKSKRCEELGIRLIHIYENEWDNPIKKEIIKSLLKISFGKVEKRIYARNCVIREISNKDAKDFNKKNHLQGHRNAQITYGLFYQNELVQLMSFSRHKKYEWEIIRGCPGSNNIVVGGVSKLFCHFISDYNPNSVFSYCDFNKFDGIGYKKLGMKFLDYTGPDMKWIIDGEVINRKPSKHSFYKKNAEDQLFGSGSKKYLWKKCN